MSEKHVEAAVIAYVDGLPEPSEGLVGWQSKLRGKPADHRRRDRTALTVKIVGALGLVVVGAMIQAATAALPQLSGRGNRTIDVNGITIVQAQIQGDTAPRMSQDEARRVAIAKFNDLQLQNGTNAPPITGATVDLAVFATGIVRAADPDGNGFLTTGSPINAWIIRITAPPQNGFNHVSGYIVVNDDTGQVVGYSVLSSN